MGLSNPTADALRALGDPYRTSIYDGQFCNGIDHVLGTLPPDALRAAGILVDPIWVAGSDHAPIWAGYQIPSRVPPIRPAWERVDRRLNVHVRKNQSEEIASLQAATVTWHENSSLPDHDSPCSLEEKNTRLEVIQEGIRSVAEKELLKPKKKVSKGIYFFGAYPIPLQMLKTHLHCLVRYLITRHYVTHTRRTAR
jgi:hypothetical protein